MSRKPLSAITQAASAMQDSDAATPINTGPIVQTGITIPEQSLKLLRVVAIKRSKEQGGRASVSSVISDMVEQNRAALEQEAGDFMQLADMI